MAFPSSFRDRDLAKFIETADNETAVRIYNSPSSPVTVEVVEGVSGTNVLEYSEVNSIASGVQTSLITYTVPVGKKINVTSLQFSGSNVAEYTLKIDNVTKAKKRTGFTDLDGVLFFNNIALEESTIIRLEVLHLRPYTGDFNATLIGVLK